MTNLLDLSLEDKLCDTKLMYADTSTRVLPVLSREVDRLLLLPGY